MDKITLNNHALNFSQLPENGVRIDDIVEKAIEVGLHAMSRDYANTGLVSKFSIGDYEKQNKAVKNAILKYCAENSGTGELKNKTDVLLAFSNNAQFETLFNAIQVRTLMGIMTRVQSPQITALAGIETVEVGDSYTWNIDTKGLPVAQRASYLSNVTVQEREIMSSITIVPKQYSIGVNQSFIRIVNDGYDFGKEIGRVAMGMLYAQYKLIVGLIFDTANATPIYNATFSASKYVKTASDLGALNGVRPVAYGTLPAWEKIAGLATTGGYMTKDKYIESAFLNKIYGVDSMIIDQATDFSAPLNAGVPEVLVPENLIVMLSSVGDKVAKLVRENFIRVTKTTNTEGALNEVSYSYFMGFDAGIATQAHFALQNVAGA